jgi:RHS repeat-associated protein
MLPDGTPVATSPTGLKVGFHGQLMDQLTGMYQMGYRWYSPVLGRWVSRDPIGLKGGLNLYGAYSNNPISHLDVFGELSFENFSNFCAGWGDTLSTIPFTSFSFTREFREALPSIYGESGGVDKKSTSYEAGEWTGVAHSCAFACKGASNIAVRLKQMPPRTRLYELGQKTLTAEKHNAYKHISDPVERGIAMMKNGDQSSLSLAGLLTQSFKTVRQGLTPEAAASLPDIFTVLYGSALAETGYKNINESR